MGKQSGETAEDRFYGWTDPGGISRIYIASAGPNYTEIDHLQYGLVSTVPLPSAAWLGLGLLALLGAVRRIRRKA